MNNVILVELQLASIKQARLPIAFMIGRCCLHVLVLCWYQRPVVAAAGHHQSCTNLRIWKTVDRTEAPCLEDSYPVAFAGPAVADRIQDYF